MEATRLLLLACAVLVAAAWRASARPQTSDTGTTTIKPHVEEPCSRQGGICLMANECPEGLLNNRTGLCPQQQSLGVECCHGLSILERRCHARGGVCRPKGECRSKSLWIPEAKDCENGEKCCVLVN